MTESSKDSPTPAPACHADHQIGSAHTRRSFLMLGCVAVLAGCTENKMSAMLPGPVWRPREMPPLDQAAPLKPAMPGMPNNVIPRTQWAVSGPLPSLMNRMLPVRHITIHHDGMDPFFANDQRTTAFRLERIRSAHRNKGWGDIGYHFAIDREGRVWQGRSLGWQGAHVKDHNEGNIGVVTLGNFDQQAPTSGQLASLNKLVSWLMHHYRVPMSNVRTHQEWPGAKTACPGTNLQRSIVAARKSHQFG